MNIPTEIQTINGQDGTPAFVVLPYDLFMKRYVHNEQLIPQAVLSACINGDSAIKAWRQYFGFSQAVMAKKLGISQPAFAQLENAQKPRKESLAKVAAALKIQRAQLEI